MSADLAGTLAALPDGWTLKLQPGGNYRADFGLLIQGRNLVKIDGNGATLTTSVQAPYTIRTAGTTYQTIGAGGQVIGSYTTTTAANAALSDLNLKRQMVSFLNSTHCRVTNLHVVGPNTAAGTTTLAHNLAYEGQHGFAIHGSQYIEIDLCSATNTHGDYAYMGPDVNTITTDVTIHNNDFSGGAGRQGISTVGGARLNVLNNQIANMPETAFDIEPNSPTAAGSVVDVLIQGNTFGAHRLYLMTITGQASTMDGIVFDSNTVVGAAFNMIITGPASGRSNIQITGNTAVNMSGQAHTLSAGNAAGYAITIANWAGVNVSANDVSLQAGRTPPMQLLKTTNCTNVVNGPNVVLFV